MRAFFLCASLLGLPASVAATEPPPGFRPLFDGQSLAGWQGWAIHEPGADPTSVAKLAPEDRAAKIDAWTADAKKHWTVEDSILKNDGHGAYLATDSEFGDIELLIEYKTVPGADSGIYLRGTPQVQIWDSTLESNFKLGADKGSGGLWNNADGAPGKDPLVKADRPFGEWNQFRIIQVGARTTVYLNGQKVVDAAPMHNFWDRAKPLPARGAILLQTHGGEICWRNIFVRDIPPAEANTILREAAGDGFTELFDGQSLAGWAGATDDYEVVEGAIVCKPKRGGNLFTQTQYSDFTFQVEYRLPPGGNNGIAVRFPGEGDPAYAGMCEVQVLDDSDPRYAKIDPRQASGSVYGVMPAARGYQRPVGEWNLMTITTAGSVIEVEINGTLVTRGDVSKVSEFMGGQPHPGLSTPTGHVGFAGHSDPVAFRAVRIKPAK